MRRHRREYEVLSEMNLTNLLDTAFVLLIAFILVSPSVRSGMQLDLPSVTEGSGNLQMENKTVSVVIKAKPSADSSEPIYLVYEGSESRVDLKDLAAKLQERRQAFSNKMDVVVEAERAASYDTFAQVIGVLKSIGIEGIGLATEPPKDGGQQAANSTEKNKISQPVTQTNNITPTPEPR